ncbi:glutamate-5-semialdehyde dehydrogenase [Chloroflexota bacterium]
MTLSQMESIGKTAKMASRRLAYLSSETKNRALNQIAEDLISNTKAILKANEIDLAEGKKADLDAAMLDRLLLDEGRLQAIAADVRTVAALPDPVGEVFDMRTLPNGLQVGRKRVPLGVIGSIYESRPNVTVDISTLCLKSGNAIILRGGKEAYNSNLILAKLIQASATKAGIPEGAVQFVADTDRAVVAEMLKMNQVIDLIIPRGGSGLIKMVKENATMPVVAGGIGVCHTYIDASAKIADAVAITYNAKVQRPTVCNALDTLLVHVGIAPDFLPEVAAALAKAKVEIHADTEAMAILKGNTALNLKPAVDEDWGKEFLALVIAVKIVPSLDAALDHVNNYTSGHSEAIITEDYTAAMRFLNEVDAACVYANASTRFTDGSQFGLGAEVGISTQKMHARGPLGLKELTSYKWIIFGNGQARP